MLLVLLYFFVLHGSLALHLQQALPEWIQHPVIQAVLVLVLAITLFSDIQHFFWQRKQNKIYQCSLEEDLKKLWHNRKNLQQRSLAYLEQSEKLKQFISEKLIDNLEYDEKFSHFKNLAAEVRHNGVISYDIVKVALEEGLHKLPETLDSPEINLGDTHRFGLPNNPLPKSQQALDALKYLWDLLDLSTAENMSQHIGDYLIECEEAYFQNALSEDNQRPGRSTHYSPALALAKTLGPFMETLEHNALIDKVLRQRNQVVQFSSKQFRIKIDCQLHLLGNPNHFILLLENLVKNALFFSGKVPFKQKSDRVAIILEDQAGYLKLSAYNRGPFIQEDKLDNIFQIGFSTRKTKEHHGKGLGMYFVKEIVQGYTGVIGVENILNQPLSIELNAITNDGEVYQEFFSIDYENKRPQLVSVSRPEPVDQLQIDFISAPLKVEFILPELELKQCFEAFDEDGCSIIDDLDVMKPKWRLDIRRKRGCYRLTITPLDIQGVELQVKLPSAESHLDGSTPCFEDSFTGGLDQLTQKLPGLNDF